MKDVYDPHRESKIHEVRLIMTGEEERLFNDYLERGYSIESAKAGATHMNGCACSTCVRAGFKSSISAPGHPRECHCSECMGRAFR